MERAAGRVLLVGVGMAAEAVDHGPEVGAKPGELAWEEGDEGDFSKSARRQDSEQ